MTASLAAVAHGRAVRACRGPGRSRASAAGRAGPARPAAPRGAASDDDPRPARGDRRLARGEEPGYAGGRDARRPLPATDLPRALGEPSPLAGGSAPSARRDRPRGPGRDLRTAAARQPLPAAAAERVPGRSRRAARAAAPLLRRGRAAVRRLLARARGGQLRRVGVQQAPERELGRRAGADAVPAVDVAGVRARRRHPRPARRDHRRGELPACERRSARLPARPLPLQPVVELRERSPTLRAPDPRRRAGLLRLLQPPGLRPDATRSRPPDGPALENRAWSSRKYRLAMVAAWSS